MINGFNWEEEKINVIVMKVMMEYRKIILMIIFIFIKFLWVLILFSLVKSDIGRSRDLKMDTKMICIINLIGIGVLSSYWEEIGRLRFIYK